MNQFNDLLPDDWLAQIGRALDRSCRGQGFESCTSLNFFRLSSTTAKVASITTMIFFHLIQSDYVTGFYNLQIKLPDQKNVLGKKY